MLSVLCRLPRSESLIASFISIITSESVSVGDCVRAVEAVATKQGATTNLVYLMIATVSKKPNSSEEVMKALERFTAEDGWDGCDKEVWSLFMHFVRLTKRKSARLLFGLSSALVRV